MKITLFFVAGAFVSQVLASSELDSAKKDLFAAAEAGMENELERLLTGGVDVNLTDDDGLTALHYAAMGGSSAAAKTLINHHANVNATGNRNMTPLMIACARGFTEFALELLQCGADATIEFESPDLTPLMFACASNHLDTVRALIAHGVDFRAGNKNGVTPLHVACSTGRQKIAELLLEHGADINSMDKDGKTPLTFACNGERSASEERAPEHRELIQMLKARGAQIETKPRPSTAARRRERRRTLKSVRGVV